MATMTIGSSYGAGTTVCISAYSDGGFEPATATYSETDYESHYIHTFTNTSGSNRSVREVAVDTLITRLVFDINSMENLCIVPNGGTVTIDFYRYRRPITQWFISGSIDTSSFTSTAPIHFNGILLPNASPAVITPIYGGLSFDFMCATTMFTEIAALQALASPVKIGTSITGKQYVMSAFPSGTLKIKNMLAHSWDAYENCFIQSVGPADPIGDWWWFPVSIVQSAYEDQ